MIYSSNIFRLMDTVTLRLMNMVIAIFSDQFKLLPVGAAQCTNYCVPCKQ